jgi:hypothetical protein
MPDQIETQMHDAIESALWQDLADALTRLEDHGLLPLPDHGEIDAGPIIHGGVRKGGYMLRRSDMSESPAYCWTVVSRDSRET